MLVLRILIGVGLAYLVLLLLAWLFQDRLAFPAPRAKLPDPKRVGVENGERVELVRSEEHTSELQSQSNIVCRLLLEKKKNDTSTRPQYAGVALHHASRARYCTLL